MLSSLSGFASDDARKATDTLEDFGINYISFLYLILSSLGSSFKPHFYILSKKFKRSNYSGFCHLDFDVIPYRFYG